MSYTCTLHNKQLIVNLAKFLQLSPGVLLELAKTTIKLPIGAILSTHDKGICKASFPKSKRQSLLYLHFVELLLGTRNTCCHYWYYIILLPTSTSHSTLPTKTCPTYQRHLIFHYPLVEDASTKSFSFPKNNCLSSSDSLLGFAFTTAWSTTKSQANCLYQQPQFGVDCTFCQRRIPAHNNNFWRIFQTTQTHSVSIGRFANNT